MNTTKQSVRSLTDRQLHQNLMTLKSKESLIVAQIVSHLEEVYRRRLFADFKCSSIYDYCTRILGYSNGEAHKKISACKLATQCVGVKESIAKGELSLSNAASVQTFLNKSSKQIKAKNAFSSKKPSTGPLVDRSSLDARSIVDRVKNKSTHECEIELEKIAKENDIAMPEKKPSKRNYGDKTQLKIYLDREKLELLKSRLGFHCEQELLGLLIDEKLKATEPKTEVKAKPRKQKSQRARGISPSKRAIALKRAQKKCENCDSKHHLQIDHRLSVAQGGSNKLENLRVLCRSCNQRAAVQQLGLTTMDKHINRQLYRTSSTLPEGPPALI